MARRNSKLDVSGCLPWNRQRSASFSDYESARSILNATLRLAGSTADIINCQLQPDPQIPIIAITTEDGKVDF